MTAKTIVYVGTYTQQVPHVPVSKGEGVHVFELDTRSGALSALSVAQGVDNPSFITVTSNRRYLYAASEVSDGHVSAFAIDPSSGALRYLNQQAAQGSATAYVAADHTASCVFAANYWDGQSVALFPINADGSLAAASSTHEHTLPAAQTVPSRQDKSHAHCIMPTPDNRFALVCDLGLDKIMIYRLDVAHGQLIPHDPPFFDMPPGAGPRHLTFHPTLQRAYVINELDSSVAVLAYDDATAALTLVQHITTLPQDYHGDNAPSDIHVSPDGSHLYAGNRGHNSLAIFAIDPQDGQLTPVDHQPTGGATPRNFVIDPSGDYVLVANQDSHTIVSFQRDPQTGLLRQLSTTDCPTPVCLKITQLTPSTVV